VITVSMVHVSDGDGERREVLFAWGSHDECFMLSPAMAREIAAGLVKQADLCEKVAP
jgi:hypothetical protein